jgi:hypothetical protein
MRGEGGFDYWRSLMRRHFALSSGRPGAEGRFDAQLTVTPFGPLTVFDMIAPKQRWTRAQRHLRTDPHDEFVLTLMVSGSGCLEQDGNQAEQSAGVISVFDTSKPYDYVQCGETLCVEIPRQLLLSRLQRPVPLGVPFSATQQPLGRLLLDIVRTTCQGEAPPNKPVETLVGTSLINLAAALFESGSKHLHHQLSAPRSRSSGLVGTSTNAWAIPRSISMQLHVPRRCRRGRSRVCSPPRAPHRCAGFGSSGSLPAIES